jgi:hypothetical protein
MFINLHLQGTPFWEPAIFNQELCTNYFIITSMPFLFFGKKKKKTKEKEDKKKESKDVKKVPPTPIPVATTAEVSSKVLFTPNYAAPTSSVTNSPNTVHKETKEQIKEREAAKEKEKEPAASNEGMPDEKKLNILFEALLVFIVRLKT